MGEQLPSASVLNFTTEPVDLKTTTGLWRYSSTTWKAIRSATPGSATSQSAASRSTLKPRTTTEPEGIPALWLYVAIGGGALVVLLLVLVPLIVCLCRKKRTKSKSSEGVLKVASTASDRRPAPKQEIAPVEVNSSLLKTALEIEQPIGPELTPILAPDKELNKADAVGKKSVTPSPKSPTPRSATVKSAPTGSRSKSKSSSDTLKGYPESPDEKHTESKRGSIRPVESQDGSGKAAKISGKHAPPIASPAPIEIQDGSGKAGKGSGKAHAPASSTDAQSPAPAKHAK